MLKYVVVIENNKTNFAAFSPDVPGCVASGNTIAEAVNEMRSALEIHIDGLDEVPLPKGLNHYMNDESFKKNTKDYILQIQLDELY
jgi:predicted RNase H-like HicB family nuclease